MNRVPREFHPSPSTEYAYEEGWHSFVDSRKTGAVCHNPYEHGTSEYSAFHAGYADARMSTSKRPKDGRVSNKTMTVTVLKNIHTGMRARRAKLVEDRKIEPPVTLSARYEERKIKAPICMPVDEDGIPQDKWFTTTKRRAKRASVWQRNNGMVTRVLDEDDLWDVRLFNGDARYNVEPSAELLTIRVGSEFLVSRWRISRKLDEQEMADGVGIAIDTVDISGYVVPAETIMQRTSQASARVLRTPPTPAMTRTHPTLPQRAGLPWIGHSGRSMPVIIDYDTIIEVQAGNEHGPISTRRADEFEWDSDSFFTSVYAWRLVE